MSRSVLVLGTHRSGTSLVAGILHNLGIPMGPNLLGASEANPKGHYEDTSFLYLNDRLVKNWKDPSVPEPLSESDHELYKNLVREREEQSVLWGVKDPRLCFTARFLLPLLSDPVIICTHREERDSALSLARRDQLEEQEALRITRAYLDERAKVLRTFQWAPVLDVRFADVLNNPSGAVKEIGLFALRTERAIEFVGL